MNYILKKGLDLITAYHFECPPLLKSVLHPLVESGRQVPVVPDCVVHPPHEGRDAGEDVWYAPLGAARPERGDAGQVPPAGAQVAVQRSTAVPLRTNIDDLGIRTNGTSV